MTTATAELKALEKEDRTRLFAMLEDLRGEVKSIHIELTAMKVRLESQNRIMQRIDDLEKELSQLREQTAASRATAERSVLVAVITTMGAVTAAVLATLV